MKNFLYLFAFLLCSAFSANAQSSNRAPGPNRYDETVYVFKTYEDFKNNKSENLGHYETFTWGNMGRGAKLQVKNTANKIVNVQIDDYWGFKIDKFVFRSLHAQHPMVVVGTKEKTFYFNGGFYLSMIRMNANVGIGNDFTDFFFYSDAPDSELIPLDKIKKEAKSNAALMPLVDCIKLAGKGHDNQEEMQATLDCLRDFVKSVSE